jgi:hypothetical protein
MRKITFAVLAAVTAAAFVLSTPVSAQNEDPGMGKGKGMNMPSFTDFDLDGDGKIVSEEFYNARAERITKHAQEGRQMKGLANAPTFEDIDTDDDGSISAEEFAAHQAEHRQQSH